MCWSYIVTDVQYTLTMPSSRNSEDEIIYIMVFDGTAIPMSNSKANIPRYLFTERMFIDTRASYVMYARAQCPAKKRENGHTCWSTILPTVPDWPVRCRQTHVAIRGTIWRCGNLRTSPRRHCTELKPPDQQDRTDLLISSAHYLPMPTLHL